MLQSTNKIGYQFDRSKESSSFTTPYTSYEGNPLARSYPNVQLSPEQYQNIATESGTKLRINEPVESSAHIDKSNYSENYYSAN